MNLDPKLGFNAETESDAGQIEEPFQEYKPRSNSPKKRDPPPLKGPPKRNQGPAFTYQPNQERRLNLEELEDDFYNKENSQNTEPVFNRARS